MRSIFAILSGRDSRRIDELTEQLAQMEGQLDAHYAALATIISLMNSHEHEAFGDIVFGKTMNGYPAWLGEKDREKGNWPDFAYVNGFQRARSGIVRSLTEQEPTTPSEQTETLP